MRKYVFGDFELDVDAMRLARCGEPVRLERRPLDLLIMLVERRDRLVAREEIIASLWPAGVIIEFDSGLNTLVRKIRNALGDTAEAPAFIETVPGRGYRFIADLSAAPGASTSEPGNATAVRSARRRAAVIALCVSVLAVAVGLSWLGVTRPAPATRIAILPFQNLSGDEQLDYLASGLAEETNASLSQIDLEGLRIIGYASANAVSRSPRPLSEIGRELDADFLVSSSLRLDGTRIRVTPRLIRVADSEQIWSASFDRELTNVLGLERELSIAIAEQVRQRLSPQVAAAIDRRQTQNPRAYELYLKGRGQWALLTPDSVQRAIGLYQQATREDASYALAWAGIAQAASTSLMVADASPATAAPLARGALEKALQFGPDLAETQYAQGYIHLFVDWDRPAAERAARRAIALDPNSAISRMLLGMTLSPMGRVLEARSTLQRARELDPLFALAWANSANVALQSGAPEEALEYSRQAVAIGPENWVAYFHLGNALEQLGYEDGALAAFADAARYSDNNSKPIASRAYLLTRLGRSDEARGMLAEMTVRASRRYVPPYAFAIIYAGLGETDLGIEALEHAIDVHDIHVRGLTTDPRLALLRSDARFATLVRRVESRSTRQSPPQQEGS